MGLRRPLAALLSFAAVAASGSDSVPLREARWIAPQARLEQLSTVDAPCIAEPTPDILYGYVAFEDPLLLGGQAARAGLSCASCHRGGRGNPAFVFPGISGDPGTADVTSSLFSRHRGDGTSNPRPIPNLTLTPPKVSHQEPGELENFIRGQIVEEFDGAEPPPQIVSSMAKFIRALDPAACKPARARSFMFDFARYAMAMELAENALRRGDRDVALAMLRAARSRLGLIAERYPQDPASPPQKALGDADAFGATMIDGIRKGDEAAFIADAIKVWVANAIAWSAPLQLAEAKSLYDPDRLAAALNATRTP